MNNENKNKTAILNEFLAEKKHENIKTKDTIIIEQKKNDINANVLNHQIDISKQGILKNKRENNIFKKQNDKKDYINAIISKIIYVLLTILVLVVMFIILKGMKWI